MVIAVIFLLFLAGFSAASPRCLQLKHSSSVLVDCEASSVMIFAQPLCENAHIVTLDSSSCNNYIAVALLGSASFLDLLQTACHQHIPKNITLHTIELPQLRPAHRSVSVTRAQGRHGRHSVHEFVPTVLNTDLNPDMLTLFTENFPSKRGFLSRVF